MRPDAIAFDVIGTLFSLEKLRGRLPAVGLPEHALEAFFGAVLRDAFAMEATGSFQPFRQVAKGSLAILCARKGASPGDSKLDEVLDGFSQLDPHPDVATALERTAKAGIPVIALTNGGRSSTASLLDGAGIAGSFRAIVATEDVGRFKPNREVYHRAAAEADVDPARLALVAAHSWDIQGASSAGLLTGLVARHGEPPHPAMRNPDVIGSSLHDVVGKLLDEASER